MLVDNLGYDLELAILGRSKIFATPAKRKEMIQALRIYHPRWWSLLQKAIKDKWFENNGYIYENSIDAALVCFSAMHINPHTLLPYSPEIKNKLIHLRGYLQVGKTGVAKLIQHLSSLAGDLQTLDAVILPSSDVTLGKQTEERLSGVTPVIRGSMVPTAIQKELNKTLEVWESRGHLEGVNFFIESLDTGDIKGVSFSPDHDLSLFVDELDEASGHLSTVSGLVKIFGCPMNKNPNKWNTGAGKSMVYICSATGDEAILYSQEEIAKKENHFVIEIVPGPDYKGVEWLLASGNLQESRGILELGKDSKGNPRSLVQELNAIKRWDGNSSFENEKEVFEHIQEKLQAIIEEDFSDKTINGNIVILKIATKTNLATSLVQSFVSRDCDDEKLTIIDLSRYYDEYGANWKRFLAKKLQECKALGRKVELHISYFGKNIPFINEVWCDEKGEMFNNFDPSKADDGTLAGFLSDESFVRQIFHVVAKLSRGVTVNKRPWRAGIDAYSITGKDARVGQGIIGRACGNTPDPQDVPKVRSSLATAENIIAANLCENPHDVDSMPMLNMMFSDVKSLAGGGPKYARFEAKVTPLNFTDDYNPKKDKLKLDKGILPKDSEMRKQLDSSGIEPEIVGKLYLRNTTTYGSYSSSNVTEFLHTLASGYQQAYLGKHDQRYAGQIVGVNTVIEGMEQQQVDGAQVKLFKKLLREKLELTEGGSLPEYVLFWCDTEEEKSIQEARYHKSKSGKSSSMYEKCA